MISWGGAEAISAGFGAVVKNCGTMNAAAMTAAAASEVRAIVKTRAPVRRGAAPSMFSEKSTGGSTLS
jgi:hypothetical protein